jgi:hypothetical protein
MEFQELGGGETRGLASVLQGLVFRLNVRRQ